MEAESSNTPAAGASDEEEEEAARRRSRGCGVAASCSAVERKENGMQLGGIGDERRRESGAKTWGEMSYLWGELAEWAGRTADLTQVRSAPPTCKRTPHCKDDKHGGGYGDMVSHKYGKVISAHGPEPASACSADSEAKRIYYASTRFSTNILALEGGPMSPERPLTDSGTERQ
ncbi:hypothetical protein BHM03_00051591, partial [Ensete ventricosum]